MRALTIAAHGGLEQIAARNDIPEPELRAPTDVRVRVHAAALNHLDLFLVEGLPGVKITPPWILGADAAGVVDAVGSAVTAVHPGDRVIINPGVSCRACEYCREGDHPLCVRYGILGEHLPGVFAEAVVVPEWNVQAIPASVDMRHAAAFPLATLTAWRMIVSRARVQPGEHVLIVGIGGGVAIAAMQIAKQIGATVWVTSTSDAKLEKARALGADHTINSRTTDVAKTIREQTGKRGVDVAVDSVGEATWKSSLGALGKRGRIVTCGGTSGPMLTTDVRRLFWNQWTILGSTMGNDAEFAAIAAELRLGHLLPPIDSVFALEDGRAAYERLASAEQFGKIVLTVA